MPDNNMTDPAAAETPVAEHHNRYSVRWLRDWLALCPVLEGEEIHPDFLPAYEGWSFGIAKAEEKKDILGNPCRRLTLRLLLRRTIAGDEDRLRAIERLDALAAWAVENPPEGAGVKLRELGTFSSRASAGTEDFGALIELRMLE